VSRDLVWITKAVAIRVHAEQLELHGGNDGFLNEDRLDAALDRPKTARGYDPDLSLEDLAARMAVGVAKGHPFVDGNKRTACVVSIMFLEVNGIEINASNTEAATVFEGVASGDVSEDALSRWFTENMKTPEW
jgi:death on curing protein